MILEAGIDQPCHATRLSPFLDDTALCVPLLQVPFPECSTQSTYLAVVLKGHPCKGLLFMTRFLASPSEDKASRRCVRRNTNLKSIDILCVCIFRQSPSFRAENYAFEKVRNRISMRTTLHSNVNAVSRCTKFIICFS